MLDLRSEIAVVELPEGHRFTIAIFTRSQRPSLTDPAAEAAIGTAARLAIETIHGRHG